MKFTNVKKWLAMLLAVCSILSLVACGKSDKDSAGDDSEKGTKVAVVFASSGLGDKSFNDALYDGMKKAESTMGIQWVYSEPKDDAEYEGLISGYADSGDCDLIICLGGSQSSSLENVAPNYPQQKFVILDAVVKDLSAITGQKAIITIAKKSVANFKLREGMPVGAKVTLRGDKMWEFLDRLFNVALPRVRDFRGISANAFDGRGNYALGVKEQLIFPEIEYDKIDKIRGMDIVICTTAQTDEEARELLTLVGAPFER